MIPTNTKEIGKAHRDALGLRFYNAIKATTEDPEKKKYFLDLLQKEEMQSDERGTPKGGKAPAG